jgi:5-methylcytosine-specific restriction endonuclease McrA
MTGDLARRVRRRARYRCEYCRLPQSAARFRHQVDHIIADQHEGGDEPSNLALACSHCNLHKGPNIAGLDPATRELTRLYDPRRDRWREHFAWQGAVLVGLTAVGRATIQVLAINDRDVVEAREALIGEGRFPPK